MSTASRINTGYNDWFPVPNRLPNAPDGFSWEPGPRGLYDPGGLQGLKAGDFGITLPTAPSTYPSRAGGRVRTFFDDFYNRIYIEPARIDFGAISGRVTANVNVWNAYHRDPVSLLSVGYQATDGLGIGGAEFPVDFAPLAYRTFQVYALPAGPAVIDSDINWHFDLPWTYPLRVTGNRSKPWLFEPSWPPTGQTYRVTYSFKTEIIASHSGKEQRIALRTSPRKAVAYQCLLSGDMLRAFKDLMWQWQHRAFVLPELTRSVDTSEPQLPGTAEMVLAEVPSWLVPDAPVLVMHAGFNDLRTVASVDGGLVTFKTNATSTWPAGTRIYPALQGHVAPELRAARQTNAVAQLDLQFEVTPLSEPVIPVPAATHTFNGRELFLKRPNWAQAVDVQQGHESTTLDYDRGPVARFTPIEFGYEARKATYLNRNRAEAVEIIDFFGRMRGRQGEFYMPTWEYDFQPKGTAQALSMSLRVEGVTLAGSYGDSTVQKAVFVLMNDGTLITRQVQQITVVSDSQGEDSLITVDAPWDQVIDTNTVVMCGWMPVWRFMSDNLVVEWVTDTVAQVSLNMVTLEDLPPESP